MHVFHRSDEPVTQSRTRLDISRTLRPIPQYTAQFVDRRVQAVVERHMRIRPQFLAKRLPPDHLSRVFYQRLQDFKGFLFQLNPHAVLSNLTQFERNFESAEARHRGQAFYIIHGLYPGELPGLDPGCPPIPFFIS